MNKKIISYCFFTANSDPNTRDHYDQFSNRSDRYWYNIPAAIAINSHVYPDFKTRVYVHENVFQQPLGALFWKLSDCPNVEICRIGGTSHNKMPMIWRMLPLWDADVELFLPRDIDSIPNVQEMIASYAFINSEYPCQGIRTHPDHSDDNCILLAGLSGYKPRALKTELPLDFTFDEVIQLGLKIDPEWKWGTDLEVIKRIFVYRNPRFVERILDTPIRGEWGIPGDKTGIKRSTLPELAYASVDLTFTNPKLLEICNKLCQWGGQPIDARPELRNILSFSNQTCDFIKKTLLENKLLKSFYLDSSKVNSESSSVTTPQPDTSIISLKDSFEDRPIPTRNLSSTSKVEVVANRITSDHNNQRGNRIYNSPCELPVILMAYNRPSHTERTLEGLKQIGAQNLYIYADGPAQGTDMTKIEQTRELIENITWTKPKVVYRESNLGLANSIRGAVTEVFNNEEFIILLEDDCVPGPQFLNFMFECYKRYENNPLVYGISGHTVKHHPVILANWNYDLYFSPRIGSWGWGTWKNRWEQHIFDLPTATKFCLDAGIDLSQGGSDIPPAIESLLTGSLRDVWTLNWVLTVFLNRGYYIYPTLSHIDNIGTDGTGVHCHATDMFKTPMMTGTPTRFPNNVHLDLDLYMSHRKYFDVANGDSPIQAFNELTKFLEMYQSGADANH